MGWIETRTGRDGKPRYIAKYRDLCGRKQSAGTFATKRKANGAWQRAEVQVAEGQVTDPRRGRQTFRRYVEERWLPHHVMEPTTREKYTYYLNAHVLPAPQSRYPAAADPGPVNPEDNRRLSVYPQVEVEPTAHVCPSGPARDAVDQGRDGRIIWAGSRSKPPRPGRGRGRSFDSGHGNGPPAHPRKGPPASMAQSCRDAMTAGTPAALSARLITRRGDE
jgi:hypothetical protein